jgi:hypothetical protein
VVKLPRLSGCLNTDECICQAPVNWEFQQLDVNSDSRLSERETSSMRKSAKANVSESCLDVFLQACDHNNDRALSEKEWCCCFADVCEYNTPHQLLER